MGDIADVSGRPAAFADWLATASRAWYAPQQHRAYYVVGNHEWAHDHATVLKTMKLAKDHYSFNVGPLHNVVINSCDNRINEHPDGQFEVRQEQLRWLADDLRRADRPTIVYCHVPLDEHDPPGDTYQRVRNRHAVWDILAADGQVVAVIQAHDHNGPHDKPNWMNFWVARVEPTGKLPYVGMSSPSHMKHGKWMDWSKMTLHAGDGKLVFESYEDPREGFEENRHERLEFRFLDYAVPARTFYRRATPITHVVDPSRAIRWSSPILSDDSAVPLEIIPSGGSLCYRVLDFDKDSGQLDVETTVDAPVAARWDLSIGEESGVTVCCKEQTIDAGTGPRATFEVQLSGRQDWKVRWK